MLAYLKCVYLPKNEEEARIQVFSKNGRCLAFKSSKKLDAGVSQVQLESSRNPGSLKIDVYNYDERYEMYEGRVVSKLQRRVGPTAPDLNMNDSSLYGELKETLIGGAKVLADRPLKTGTVLRLEVDDEESSEGSIGRLAEVMWAKPIADSSYEIRLRYHEESFLNQIVSGCS